MDTVWTREQAASVQERGPATSKGSRAQDQANRSEDCAPRRMSMPEREARKDRLRRLLAPCIVIGGIIDPADVVINKFLQMAEENTPRWVAWECAPGRSPKLAAEPRGKKKWLPEAKGRHCGEVVAQGAHRRRVWSTADRLRAQATRTGGGAGGGHDLREPRQAATGTRHSSTL